MTNTTLPVKAEEALARRDLYGTFAAAFLNEPTRDFVELIRTPGFIDDLADTFGENAVETLKSFCSTFDGHHNDIVLDYNALFKVPGANYVTPYESVYLDKREVDGETKDGLLMGPTTQKVKVFWKKAGFNLSNESKELTDYVGHEFDFISRLCEEELRACEGKDEKLARACQSVQLKFLEQHLGRWIGALSDNINGKAATDFYKGIGQLAKAFVLLDIRTLTEWL